MSGSSSTPLPAAVVVRSGFRDTEKGALITDAAVINELFEAGFGASVIAIHPDAAETTMLEAKHAAAHAEPQSEEH